MPPRTPSSHEELLKAVQDLQKSIERTSKRYEGLFNTHPLRGLLLSFAKGVAGALGAVAAFAVVIPITVYLLRSVNWGPMVGDFVSKIVDQIELQQKNPPVR